MLNDENLDLSEKRAQFAVPYYEISYEKFFQFGLSVDCVVFGYHENKLKVLLIRRGAAPFKGEWALPGDLVYPNENIDVAARRIVQDLTGISKLYMEQTKVYGQVDRHPAGRVITTGYYSLIDIDKHDPQASAWADGVYWMDLDDCPSLAFDHDEILKDAVQILRDKVRHRPIGFELLPKKFALAQLQELYEALLNADYDKANFRKRILSKGLLIDLKEYQTGVSHRPARLYSFDEDRYNVLKEKGFSFEL
ncbi:MAG: NUDIX domain-containing protein [Schleiferiaceae bacterium]|jgi:8-oxo-dGTP diphosphatase|nr:NUDIX domain-containing protein [Schleiferiaceae bacterium]